MFSDLDETEISEELAQDQDQTGVPSLQKSSSENIDLAQTDLAQKSSAVEMKSDTETKLDLALKTGVPSPRKSSTDEEDNEDHFELPDLSDDDGGEEILDNKVLSVDIYGSNHVVVSASQ
jgi:hypothetical protein